MRRFRISPELSKNIPSRLKHYQFRQIIKTLILVMSGSLILFLIVIIWLLYPHQRLAPLPSYLVEKGSARGKKLLQESTYKADYTILSEKFEPQIFSSFCGVASSVIVLNALGQNISQTNFFITNTNSFPKTSDFSNVLFSGMTLRELDQFLLQKGANTKLIYAKQLSLEQFRKKVIYNLRQPNDFMIINYSRKEIGQGKVGHISPIAAYESKSDMVLILDTASHRYPHTWVPINRLFKAMKAFDTSANQTRGLVEVFYKNQRTNI